MKIKQTLLARLEQVLQSVSQLFQRVADTLGEQYRRVADKLKILARGHLPFLYQSTDAPEIRNNAHRRIRRVRTMIKVIDIQHPLAGALIYWAAALAIGVPMLIFTVYSTSYMVEVNGQVAGVVEDKEDFTRLVSEVERTAAQILEEEDYRFEGEITYTRALSQPEDFTSRQEIKNFLMGQIGEVMMRYLLTVEGEVVGVAQSQEELEVLTAHYYDRSYHKHERYTL